MLYFLFLGLKDECIQTLYAALHLNDPRTSQVLANLILKKDPFEAAAISKVTFPLKKQFVPLQPFLLLGVRPEGRYWVPESPHGSTNCLCPYG